MLCETDPLHLTYQLALVRGDRIRQPVDVGSPSPARRCGASLRPGPGIPRLAHQPLHRSRQASRRRRRAAGILDAGAHRGRAREGCRVRCRSERLPGRSSEVRSRWFRTRGARAAYRTRCQHRLSRRVDHRSGSAPGEKTEKTSGRRASRKSASVVRLAPPARIKQRERQQYHYYAIDERRYQR